MEVHTSKREFKKDFGKAFRRARILNDHTLDFIAENCEVSVATVRNFEKGISNVSMNFIIKYFETLGEKSLNVKYYE